MATLNSFYPLYKEPLAHHSALWADLYAVTMSQAAFTSGKHNIQTTFHAYIRQNPFKGGYLVTGGQNIVFEWLRDHWRFDEDDIALLRRKTVADPATGQHMRLFSDDFIDMVSSSRCELTIDAMPEGEIAFPDQPIYRVSGPFWQCLMVEAAILNVTNSQSLFATLASRLVEIADGAPVLEFGLRRAQGLGGLEATRGAYLGGIDATSNMLAEKYYGIESRGTFAHALVMVAEDELHAFRDYAAAMPYNGVFLVDTYNTLEGVKRAVQACQETGIALKGIRLDSGDLTYLSKKSRKILDAAGFTDATITASNDLDEETISAIKAEGGKIDIWAVGTHLVTSKPQPALGAVYKLGAVFDADLGQEEIDAMRQLVQQGRSPVTPGFVRDVIKLSEQAAKTTIPGELDVLRYISRDPAGHERFDGDTIIANIAQNPVHGEAYDGDRGHYVLSVPVESVRKDDYGRSKIFPAGTPVYRPLQRYFSCGALVGVIETVHEARARVKDRLAMLDQSHRRLKNPHLYPVGIEAGLFEKRMDMIRRIRKNR